MFELPLTRGGVAIVDDEDRHIVAPYNWCLHTKGYAVASSGLPLMHRLLMNADAGADVDHRNGDKLDNRRSNLRVTTRKVNSRNRTRPDPRSRSGVPGVTQRRQRFIAYFWHEGRWLYLGSFGSLAGAAIARVDAELTYNGEVSTALVRVLERGD